MSTHNFLICRNQAERLVDLMMNSPQGRETPLYEFHQELREKFGMTPVPRAKMWNHYMEGKWPSPAGWSRK